MFLSLVFIVTYSSMAVGQIDTSKSKKRKRAIIFELEMENGGMLTQRSVKETTYQGAYYNGFNAKIGWGGIGEEDQYLQIHNFPIYGIGFYSSTFNSDVIGNPYALYGFVQTPIAPKASKKWSYDYRIGLGLSGNFNPYDEDKNPLNLVIGSKRNVFIDLGIRAQYQFYPKWRAGLGLAFHHFSNGALALPNKGINLIPLTISINYQPTNFEPVPRDTIIPYSDKIIYDVNYGAGVKQLDKNLKDKYFKAALGIYASKYISYKWRIGAGYDMFYSASGLSEEIAGEKSGELSSILSGGPSIYLVHILNNQLQLNGNIGYYLHSQYFNGEIKKVFLRAGARYYIYKGLNVGLSIKAHAGKADFIEWTAGYTLNKK